MNREAWVLETENRGVSGRIAHVAEPWFACSFAPSSGEAGEFYGLVVEMEGLFFHGFVWKEGIPHEDVLRELCAEAGEVIEARRGCL